MTYSKTKIPVLDPKTWYNKAAKIYKQFHEGLASYDKWLFQRFLPRDIADSTVLDIWSGDARLYSFFSSKHIKKYIWFDTAELLLKRAPSRVERVVWDIEENRPFDDESIDIWLCFFVLTHLRDLQHFFQEAKRVLKPGWSLIILHNFQRREYVYEMPNDTFKIEDHHWKPTEIETIAYKAWFDIDAVMLEEKETNIWILYNMKS